MPQTLGAEDAVSGHLLLQPTAPAAAPSGLILPQMIKARLP